MQETKYLTSVINYIDQSKKTEADTLKQDVIELVNKLTRKNNKKIAKLNRKIENLKSGLAECMQLREQLINGNYDDVDIIHNFMHNVVM